jgi:hypothetical protein
VLEEVRARTVEIELVSPAETVGRQLVRFPASPLLTADAALSRLPSPPRGQSYYYTKARVHSSRLRSSLIQHKRLPCASST